MYIYRSKINFKSGFNLGGYGKAIDYSNNNGGDLEVHGVGFKSVSGESIFELCSIDALYAGDLARKNQQYSLKRIFAASHTHFAPMLDSEKPDLGIYSPEAVNLFNEAIENSKKMEISINKCSIFKSSVSVPIYRRFDFPASQINKCLTKHAGFYPNAMQKIDKSIYIFVFSFDNINKFCIVYHACHPVSRSNKHDISPDYIEAIRSAIFQRFNIECCLFFLGCAGDIRPNYTKKRIPWLPASRLNTRFNYSPSISEQDYVDKQYYNAIFFASKLDEFNLTELDFIVNSKKMNFDGVGEIEIPELIFKDKVKFMFFPFEVSHHYHMENRAINSEENTFIVSCSNHTLGYLPHPYQHHFGGYEVDGSRKYNNLKNRVKLIGKL